MGFHLSSLFQYQNTNPEQASQQTSSPQSAEASHYHTANEIRSYMAGQTISGEIVAVRGSEVDIALAKDMVLTAKLDREMNLILGQTMTFEIKSNNHSQIALRPLFENLAPNPNITNAIQASHIPFNNTSVELVSKLMEAGMPIDKQTLQTLYKQLVSNQTADLATIIRMNRLQIPLTPEHIEQFTNYKNYEHSIVQGAETIAEHLMQAFSKLLESGSKPEIMEFYQKLVSIFGENKASLEAGGHLQETQIALGETADKQGVITAGSEGKVPAGHTVNAALPKITITDIPLQAPLSESLSGPFPGFLPEGAQKTEAEGKSIFTEQDAKVLAVYLEQAGASTKDVQAVITGAYTPERVMQLVNELLFKGEATKLLESKEFSKLVKQQITERFLIEPKAVGAEGKVEELYERIRQQTAKLTEAMQSLAKDNPTLAKSVSNLSNNVEFMNQLNQVFTYVQLPLKMSNEHAHGELYVYTKKKNLAKKDGSVSALLHLDMEYLGTMDIYVAMQEKKVQTKFYLQKEEYLDFIAMHLPELDEKLKKRGYQMHAEVLPAEKKVNVMEEMTEQNKNTGLLAKYSFDVRA